MSRRQNNLKRMKEAKMRKKQMREAAGQPDAGIPGGDQRAGGAAKGKVSEGSVTIMDKFTGEVREGGPELLKEMFANVAREREMFLSSRNPCYLIGRVMQNEGSFDAAEIKRMVDATFECACQDSPDAWYPNQYALSLAHAAAELAAVDVAYFLSNFELGLRTSGERAARHLGQGDWLKESRQLASRVDVLSALDGLTSEDYRNITAHVASHPRFAEAMSSYERGSGNKMQSGNDADTNKGPMSEEHAHALLVAAGMDVLKVGRDEVERMDLSESLRKLRGLTFDSATVAAQQGRLGLVFSGWESDPRELWEINEVRAYFAALDREFPYLIWFLMPGQIQLSILLLCHSEKVSGDGHTTLCQVDQPSLASWYARQTDALAELGASHGLNKTEVTEVFRSVTRMIRAGDGLGN